MTGQRPSERDFEIRQPYDRDQPDVEPGSRVDIQRDGETVWTGHVVDPEDVGAGQGLVIGLVIGVAMWTILILSWRSAAFRDVVLGVLKVFAVVGVFWLVLAASHRIVERWRQSHPDNPVVDWLRKSGL